MDLCKIALSVIEMEAQAVFDLARRIDDQFEKACRLLLACKGRVVVTGMGKSGHIGRKIAATLSSTGTPSFFMHPGEAGHGDLGMMTADDLVIAISNSGTTQEILTLLPLIKRFQIPLIALTGNPQSTLAQYAEVNLDLSISQEACPLGLAPTASTTVALVMGDALAVTLLQAKGFSVEDFARSYPGGSLGKKLLLYADELAHAGDALPVVHETVSISQALIEVTSKKLGMTCVVDHLGKLTGIYTDGDIRRTLTNSVDLHKTPLNDVMTRECKTITQGLLASEALSLMQKYSITSLVIINEQREPQGVIHIHDILRAGII